MLCQKSQNKDSDQVPATRPKLISVDTAMKKVTVDTIVKIVQVDSVEKKNEFRKNIVGIEPVGRKIKVKKLKNKSVDTIVFISPKIDKADTVINVIKSECLINQPESMYAKQRPNTNAEAQEWARWMYAKAACFMYKNLDSCFYFTQRGIQTYENGSLFYLKTFCLLEKEQYSAAKTAAEVCINRVDHWNKKDKTEVIKLKIEALKGLMKTFPSSVIEKEIENAQNAYKLLTIH